MEQNKKNNAFGWILRFAGQCRGLLTASVSLAILGSACGVIPYLAVTQIIIRLLSRNYELVPIGLLSGWNLAEHSLHHAEPPISVYDPKKYPYGVDCKAFTSTNGNHFGHAFRKV